tara:strand:+ start:1637 stop:2182 length:546 start_codon:yes stop_codon:yes gene_type:complete
MNKKKEEHYPIFEIEVGKDRGAIGISFCPGIKDPEPSIGARDRNIDNDVGKIADWGAAAIVTLMESEELIRYGVSNIGETTLRNNMLWYHNPIKDMEVPDKKFENQWEEIGPLLRSFVGSKRNIFIHCRGGFGRSGVIAARLLVEFGYPAIEAIRKVRDVRPGSLETIGQENNVIAFSKGI